MLNLLKRLLTKYIYYCLIFIDENMNGRGVYVADIVMEWIRQA